MTPPVDKKALARERLAARRRRIQDVRRSVAVAAVSVFIALFSTVYIQMASGHDPVLGSQTASATSTSTPTATSTPDTGTEASTAQTETPAPVTTTQS